MQRYRGPASMFLASVAIIGIALVIGGPAEWLGQSIATIGLCVYLTATIWWVARSLAPSSTPLLYAALVWGAAAPIVSLFLWSMVKTAEIDVAIILPLLLIWPTALICFVCAMATIVILLHGRRGVAD